MSLNFAKEQADVQPIIFEECYVSTVDRQFVEKVKNSSEITEKKVLEQHAAQNGTQKQLPNQSQVGVHLFVLVHGF